MIDYIHHFYNSIWSHSPSQPSVQLSVALWATHNYTHTRNIVQFRQKGNISMYKKQLPKYILGFLNIYMYSSECKFRFYLFLGICSIAAETSVFFFFSLLIFCWKILIWVRDGKKKKVSKKEREEAKIKNQDNSGSNTYVQIFIGKWQRCLCYLYEPIFVWSVHNFTTVLAVEKEMEGRGRRRKKKEF